MGDWSWLTGVGAILASLVALWNQRYSNKEQDRRQLEWFKRESEEKHLERTIQLRKEVYLELASAIGRFQDYYGKTAQRAVEDPRVVVTAKGVNEAFAKVVLIAEGDLLKAVGNFQTAHAGNFANLTNARLELVRLEEEKKALAKSLEKTRSESGPVQQTSIEVGAAISKQLDSLELQLFNSRMALVTASSKALKALAKPFAEVAGAVRKELNLEITDGTLKVFTEEQEANADRLRRLFGQRIAVIQREKLYPRAAKAAPEI